MTVIKLSRVNVCYFIVGKRIFPFIKIEWDKLAYSYFFGCTNRNQSFVKILKSPTGLLFNTKVSNHIQDVLVKVCNIQQ